MYLESTMKVLWNYQTYRKVLDYYKLEICHKLPMHEHRLKKSNYLFKKIIICEDIYFSLVPFNWKLYSNHVIQSSNICRQYLICPSLNEKIKEINLHRLTNKYWAILKSNYRYNSPLSYNLIPTLKEYKNLKFFLWIKNK